MTDGYDDRRTRTGPASKNSAAKAQTAAAVLNRALIQRVTFFTAWQKNLDVAPQLANQAWRSEAGALEGSARNATGDIGE
ncbi:hypothetical protein [Streptomyces sp. NPDC005303]|uniref:hypothetical protein n=1 Tax=Streptomyces sp. NPDC005303 TaxID=3155713 RepID=UPI0033AE155D